MKRVVFTRVVESYGFKGALTSTFARGAMAMQHRSMDYGPGSQGVVDPTRLTQRQREPNVHEMADSIAGSLVARRRRKAGDMITSTPTDSNANAAPATSSNPGSASPLPDGYVPVEERAADDESLQFLRKPPAKPLPPLGPGQIYAPELKPRQQRERHYMDENAARLRTTSVMAGQSLIPKERSRNPLNERFAADRTAVLDDANDFTEFSRIAQSQALDGKDQRGLGNHAHAALSDAESTFFQGKTSSEGPLSDESSFGSGEGGGEGADNANGEEGKEKLSLDQQLREDLRKLEYYEGTPEYPKLLAEFRKKYDDSKMDAEAARVQKYSDAEIEQGLEAQPIDYLRSSAKLQGKLSQGPQAWNPVTIMQQQGVMRFQGYAFPPTQQLGQLNLEDIKKKDLPESIKKQMESNVDTHILNRTLGLDAVQRRQMKLMLTDFDYNDRNTAFHVMMTYPYTDWLHVLFMVVVGMTLYNLQVKYRAYQWYDEYLGLDLRQVPRLERPILAGVTIFIMVFLLFQPLMVASIASTRAYRIVMRRPIGPP